MKTALITGVGKGIGKALTEKFLAEGFEVLGTVFTSEDSADVGVQAFMLDLASPESITACVKALQETGKKLDVLINNAGVLLDEGDTAIVIEKLRGTLEVNLIGTIDFTEQMLPLMREGGHIVNISSTAGSLARAEFPSASHEPLHYPAYKISKTALNMYTRTLALRLQDKNIIVSSVHPGWVQTDMGGDEAEMTSAEAADGIYSIATSLRETGGFWFGNERLPW